MMSSEYEIEVVTPEEGKEEVPPFLVSFPGGNIASLADGAFSVMQSESSKKRKRHVVETEVGDLRFIATDRLAMQDLVRRASLSLSFSALSFPFSFFSASLL